MTLARTIATGHGKLSFRLSIDGFQYEPVSSAAMQKTTSDDRIRRVGLKREGISDDWQCQVEMGTVKAAGFTVTIADYNDVWLGQFANRATKVSGLKATASSGSTSWNVTSSTDFTADTYIYIGQETVKLTAKPSATQMTVSRGKWSSNAVKYWVDTTTDGSLFTQPIRITDRPERLEGRRCRLFVYGDGDDPQGEGTQEWLGVVATEPAMKGANEWTFQLDPITRKFEQYIGSDLGASMPVRGIRRLSDLQGTIYYWSTTPTTTLTFSDSATFTLDGPGFWETQEEFCRDLTTALGTAAATIGAWSTPRIWAQPEGEGGYNIHWIAPAGGVWVGVVMSDSQDRIDGRLGARGGWVEGVYSVTNSQVLSPTIAQTSGNQYRCLTAEEVGEEEIAGARTVPRGCVYVSLVAGAVASSEFTRLYLGGDQDISSIAEDLAIITVPGTEGSEARSMALSIAASDNTDRWIEVSTAEELRFTAANPPEIKQTRYYARGTNVGEFVFQLCANAFEYSSMGAYPALSTLDIDSTAWRAGGQLGLAYHPVLASRNYFASQPIRLDKMLTEELKAGGLMMVPNSTGKITVQTVRMPARLSSELVTLNDSHINLRAGYPEWEPSRFGSLNSVTFKASYDPVKEQHYKPTYLVMDDRARAGNPTGQRLSIEMYSEWPGMFTWSNGQRVQTLMTETELFMLFADTLGLFGQPYQIIRVPCTMVHADTAVGASVALTCAHVPDWDGGTRGVQDLPCLVIGRKREWDRGVVWLTLMAQGPAKVAYTPSFRVSSASGATTSWTLTVANSIWAGGDVLNAISMNVGGSDPQYFYEVGDRIEIWKWNNATPAAQTGTVASLSSTTIGVTFDASWAGVGGLTWIVSYAKSNDATGIGDSQKLYAYIADTTHRIDVDGAVIDARVYS